MSVKTIKIGDKSFDMKSSAFTIFKYKDDYGKDLLQEVAKISDKVEALETETDNGKIMKITSDVIQSTLEIAYVMIKEQNKSCCSFDEFVSQLDGLMDDNIWMVEVLQMATAPFQRRVNTSIK